jgi:hypothetical protein
LVGETSGCGGENGSVHGAHHFFQGAGRTFLNMQRA